MKSLFLIITLIIATPAFSSELCEGISGKHLARAEQKGHSVEVTLQNSELSSYGQIGKVKISGKEISTIVVEDLSLDSFMSNSSLGEEVFVKLIYGRREFDGEYDMAYSYAEDFFHSLKCR